MDDEYECCASGNCEVRKGYAGFVRAYMEPREQRPTLAAPSPSEPR